VIGSDGHSDYEALTVRTALRVSSNRAAAQMLQTIGIGPAVDRVHSLGLDAPPVPSLVLGTGDVTLLDLTTAYGAFANGGLRQTPRLIRRVEDTDGTVLFSTTGESVRAVSEQTAFQMAEMLADVVNRGTGAGVRQAGFELPAAGKTGTTNEYRDAWFVGFTPNLVAGVWVGYDRPRTIVPGGYASQLAVPLWGTFMREATRGSRSTWIDQPEELVAVEICQDSGLLPNAACRRVERISDDGDVSIESAVAIEYFKAGSEPHEHCPLHDYSWFRGVQTASFDPGEFPAAVVIGALPAHARAEPVDDEPAVMARQPVKAAVDEDDEEDEGRGFWGRFLGVFTGGDDDDDDGEDDDQDDGRRRGPNRFPGRVRPGGAR